MLNSYAIQIHFQGQGFPTLTYSVVCRIKSRSSFAFSVCGGVSLCHKQNYNELFSFLKKIAHTHLD